MAGPKKPLFRWRDEICSALELIAGDRHTLHVIGFSMDENGADGFPSIKLIVERTGYTKQTVLDALAWAKHAGWLIASGRSRFGTTVYLPAIPEHRLTVADRAAFMRDRREASKRRSAASPERDKRVASFAGVRSRRRTTEVGLDGEPSAADEDWSRTLKELGLDGGEGGSRTRTTTSSTTSPTNSPNGSSTAVLSYVGSPSRNPYECTPIEVLTAGVASRSGTEEQIQRWQAEIDRRKVEGTHDALPD